MNTNRTRYTSTPTFGMQKRNLFGSKKGLFQKAEPTAPDFTKVPPQAEIPNPAFFSVPTQNPMYQDPGQMPPPYAAPQMSPQGVPGVTPMPSGYAQQPGYPMDPMGSFSSADGMPGLNGMPGNYSSNLPPLGAGSQQLNSSFISRGQGFVPPQQTQPQPQTPPPTAPEVQPAGFGGLDSMNPYGAASMQQGNAPFYPQQNSFYPPASPGYAPSFQQQQPANGNMQSNFMRMAAQNQNNQPRNPASSMNPNMLWMVFLFGLLPLLFIPCLFVSQGLNILRYLFLVLCLTGLGVMWYRQLLSPVVRIVVSAVYVGMCIFTISTLMKGNSDVQLAPPVTQGTPAAQVQYTPVPSDYDYAAQAGLAPPVEEPTPTPTPPTKSDAEIRLEFFMNYWCGNNVQDMVSLVQPSWATAQDSAVTSLFNLLTNRLPLSYQLEDISGTDDDTSRTITMTAEIDKQNGKDPVLYRFTVLMVKEGGQWYVNPNSLATNDALSVEEVVVNDKTSNLTTTEAPRTTVSPAPPGETTLYYNPNGGHYYHMDAYCESIEEKYRPLTGTFRYFDLREYSGSLSPCLRCGAPTTALPTNAPQ